MGDDDHGAFAPRDLPLRVVNYSPSDLLDSPTAMSSAGSTSPQRMTMATSLGKNETRSVASVAHNHPNAPHPTRANTDVGGSADDYLAFHLAEKLARLSTESPPNSEKGAAAIPPASEFPEGSNWADDAESSVLAALARLQQLAHDEHKSDPDKTSDEYFGERLAKLLKQVKFDIKYLDETLDDGTDLIEVEERK